MNRMKATRLERGWTQTALGYKANVPASEISRIETGRVLPSLKQSMRLGRVLKLAPETLLDEVTVDAPAFRG